MTNLICEEPAESQDDNDEAAKENYSKKNNSEANSSEANSSEENDWRAFIPPPGFHFN